MSPDELRVKWDVARERAEAALAAKAAADRDESAAELAYLEATGQGECLRAQWIRALGRGDIHEMDRLDALMYPDIHRRRVREMEEIERELPSEERPVNQ